MLTGILSRVTLKWSTPCAPRRTMSRFAIVPLGPRSLLMMLSRSIFTPAIFTPFTAIMRSPANTPARSQGPLLITCSTMSVSFTMLKLTPMPSKLPVNGSFSFFVSLGLVYEEWGSSLLSIPLMASSANFCWSTLSTYKLVMATWAICSFFTCSKSTSPKRDWAQAGRVSKMANNKNICFISVMWFQL